MPDEAANVARGPAGMLAGASRVMRIAAEGMPLVGGAGLLAVISFVLGFVWPGVLLAVLAAAIAAFFRDPERFPERTEGVVLAGADGRVIELAQAPFPGGGEACTQVSIFMSPLNVHVNRAPVGGEVTSVEHTPGEYGAAFRDHASEHNERNLIAIRGADGHCHTMVQVAGYLARRIICRVRVHDRIESGQRVGLIMFGSRVDQYVPRVYRVTVATGERVRAGETVIAELEK